MRIFLEEKHDLPLARITLTWSRGAAEDPEGREGLAQFAVELARRGAGGRSREELDEAVDVLGADLGASAGHDAVSFEIDGMTRHLGRAVGLLLDVALRADLDVKEADQLRRETLAALDELRENDPALARRFFARALFGDTPYGRTALGTRASIARLDGAAARRWLEQTITSGGLMVGLAGDVDDRFAASLGQRFAVLRTEVGRRAALPRIAPRRRLLVVDKPGRTQAQILVGQPIVAWSDPDYLPLAVATNAFGGTFTARLMKEVRSERGLSYGASARMGQGRGPRSLIAHVFPAIERTGETLRLVLDLWRDWAERGLEDAELAFAREHLASSFALHIVTPEDRLDLRVSAALAGLPDDHLQTVAARIRAVTVEDVRLAMTRHLTPHALTIVVLATAKKLGQQLAGLGDVEVVPFDSY